MLTIFKHITLILFFCNNLFAGGIRVLGGFGGNLFKSSEGPGYSSNVGVQVESRRWALEYTYLVNESDGNYMPNERQRINEIQFGRSFYDERISINLLSGIGYISGNVRTDYITEKTYCDLIFFCNQGHTTYKIYNDTKIETMAVILSASGIYEWDRVGLGTRLHLIHSNDLSIFSMSFMLIYKPFRFIE